MGHSLPSMQAELKSITHEIESISNSLKSRSRGIGSEVCVSKLNSFVDDCEEAIRNLEHVAERRREEEAKERARLEQERLERERLERERQQNATNRTIY